jgi:hypothetical protein
MPLPHHRPSPRKSSAFLALALAVFAPVAARAAAIGVFDSASDIGKIDLKGSTEYLADKATYRITGSGKNIWFTEDACQFVWKKMSGDLVFSMEAGWEAEGKEPHRKACAMVRQTLDADSPYLDVAVHGDGLIEMQYRTEKGGPTLAARTPIQAPATVKLERDGEVFTVSVAKGGGLFQPVGAVSLRLPDPVYAGLAVSAHNATNRETALITNVTLKNRVAAEGEKRVRETSLETLAIETGERRLIYRDMTLFEAPNWSRDGKLFYFNRAGGIWTLPVAGGEPKQLDTGAAQKNNNDHGLSFDGQWLALSSGTGENGSKIYVVPATGGEAREVTPNGPSYWHGWSPDGKTLAYCAKRNGNFDVYTIPTAGGEEKRLTDAEGLDDGPEYTADGSKIYFQSERTGGVPKIWRMNPDGSGQEQVTSDENYADWFPHPSPDGKWIAFLSYDRGVKGHPANQNVLLRLLPMGGGKPKVIATLFGGQGTMNVPSWSPDSKQIAFVSYRQVLASAAEGKAQAQGGYQGKPFQGRAQPIPGRLECELYDEGGEGVAYHETDGRNHGSGELNKGASERDNFRKEESVDLSYTKDGWDNSEFNRTPQELGRFYLGWTATNEWIRYTVDIAKAGLYSLDVMYTSRYDGGILLECDERAAGDPVRLASTADARDERRNWHHWNHHAQTNAVSLPAGRHVLTIKILEPGNLNLDRIDFTPAP